MEKTTKIDSNKAELYRMVTDEHVCPFGIKARDLLERKGFELDDNWLRSREETDQFKEKHNVETTPQAFIGGVRIGGYDALRRHFGMNVKDDNATTYQPVIAIFAMTALMALAAAFVVTGSVISIKTAEWFIAFSMCVLAIMKLRDLESFSNMFVGYDLLARKVVRYAYFYPFAEGLAGVLMIADVFIGFAAPLALFIGGIGAVSVFKAVYIDKRDLKCACVGGNSNVPLGFISLTENIMMIAMGVWMLI